MPRRDGDATRGEGRAGGMEDGAGNDGERRTQKDDEQRRPRLKDPPRLLDKRVDRKPVRRRVPARSDAVVDRPQELRNALRRLAKHPDKNADASAAFSRTSARTSSAPTSATGAPGADQGKLPAISELTAHRQAARSAARCVNGGSLPSTSTSGRPDACMTGQQCGDGWSRAVPAVPRQVRPLPTVARRPRRARGSVGTASNEKKDRRAPLSLS